MTVDEYKELLEKRLSKKRYFHSLCVADEAVRLAKKYGGDEEKAFYAGLLHDVMKDATPEEQLQTVKQFDIILNNIEKRAPKLWHAITGSVYLKEVLGINDEEIISAVRYHTTAKADMTLLEKILYLADFTSSDRDYDDVDILRRLVNEDLEKAFMYALSYSIKDLAEKGMPIHEDTFKAYNQAAFKD